MRWLFLITVVLASLFALAQAAPQPRIETQNLPTGVVNERYNAQLKSSGGVPPYRWRLEPSSTLPPGLTLETNGTISGTPQKPGEYHFTLELADSAGNAVQKTFTVTITAAFGIMWRKPPAVSGNAINGEVVVLNETAESVELTVIVLAVSEIDKAFALGYQHFTVPPRSQTVPIPFGSTLPMGSYVVHADAVGEVTATGHIYRSRLQTSAPFKITQP